MERNKNKTRVLFPIGAKLVIIISVLLLVSLGAVILMVSVIITEDVRRTAEDNNFTLNYRAGQQAEGYLKSIQDAVILYLNMSDRILPGQRSGMERGFFSRKNHIAAIETENIFIANEAFLFQTGITAEDIQNHFKTISENTGSPDIMVLINASPVFNHSMISAGFTHSRGTETEIVKVLFTTDELSETFGTGTNTSFFVTDTGDLLLHPDNNLVLEGANFSSLPIVTTMLEEGDKGRQITFADETGTKYFGAYYHLDGADCIVITTISHEVVFEAVKSITLMNILLTGIVLFLAILFIWFFSKMISSPVRVLASAALQIECGDFGIDLKPSYRDELGLLTESFNKMSTALNIFGRFTNKDIAVRAMRGDIKPGGLPKHATIFFSDIRAFTEKSENFTKIFAEEASNRIVLWLNEYFKYMVKCVEKTSGVVDKFIGDAVMAHWGTAFTAGSPESDAFNGVKCALMMRNALHKLNTQRKKDDPGNPAINIGCGLNTGIVTAGQIGSDERMEYTVIGDPVNLASRVESLNKPLGTDILISEDTWKLVGDKFITEEMPSVTVKGKEKPVRLFAVVNLKGAECPQTLAEVRTLLGIPTPDISKADTNAEEKKYKIQGD